MFKQDAKGNIYLGDNYNNRIRSLSCAPCPPGVDCSSGAPGGAWRSAHGDAEFSGKSRQVHAFVPRLLKAPPQ